ncbi:hypothetical protein J2045_003410 [Peteryoungia aggregata LMG 23059]|uniref:Uncharacterized protein n=1 Tax=Peteryoungia aggregata LMG 23059 TaxID=1368425 RepID=A0ABU0GCL8_9HYPH|nr:hypothetical protein [Peteryoungia aggregata]MDQ0422362.1 hypothetical protein [Peteryoungia aggregata LMG 23059]
MTLLTAKEALEISRKNDPEQTLRNILELVKLAAAKGEYSIKVREWGFGSAAYYCPPQEWPTIGKTVIGQLREIGYSADIGSEERQFVAVWLEVSWGDKAGAA